MSMSVEQMIEVLQAWAHGKKIQMCRKEGGEWVNCIPDWNFAFLDYRVKPEPREWWIVVPKHSELPLWVSSTQPTLYSEIQESIHVREVLD